jgi:hypothetical protein
MGNGEWLEGYSGQTTAELLALEGRFRSDSLVLAFEEAVSRKAVRVGAARLTSPERVVLAVEALERAVNSDGFVGLFSNAPEQVPNLVASLMAIGRADVAELTGRAIAELAIEGRLTHEAVSSGIDRDDDERDRRLSRCDSAYYQSAGDLAEPVLDFIRSHQDQIALP